MGCRAQLKEIIVAKENSVIRSKICENLNNGTESFVAIGTIDIP